jgi:hypothetical protein
MVSVGRRGFQVSETERRSDISFCGLFNLPLVSCMFNLSINIQVMEHESFENEEIAKIMNENFVNIKVDREERPDVRSKRYINRIAG